MYRAGPLRDRGDYRRRHCGAADATTGVSPELMVIGRFRERDFSRQRPGLLAIQRVFQF